MIKVTMDESVSFKQGTILKSVDTRVKIKPRHLYHTLTVEYSEIFVECT